MVYIVVKDPPLIPIVGMLDNTERGGESILITFNNLKPLLTYPLKHRINKIHITTFIKESQLGKPQTLSITTKLYLQLFLQASNCWRHQSPSFSTTTGGCYNTLVSSCSNKQGSYNTLFSSHYYKEDETPLQACNLP